MQFWYRLRFKRNWTHNHGVETNSSRPHIGFKIFIALALNQLRWYISWSSTLFIASFALPEPLTHSKIANFDFTHGVDHQILQFDIPVQDPHTVQGSQTLNNLLEEILRRFFIDSPSFLNVAEQVAPRTQLHHKAHVLRRFKVVIYLHDVPITARLDQGHLLFSARLRFKWNFFLNWFYRD